LIHKFAFGQLGWKPIEYYTSTPYEFFCACEGYFDLLDTQAQMHRLAAYRIHQSLVEKPLKIQEFWPLFGDKAQAKKDTLIVTDELWNKIKQTHNIL